VTASIHLFRNLIAELEASREIDLIRGDVGEGSDPDYIQGFLKNNGFTASHSYLDFYAAVDAVVIEWVVTQEAISRLGLETNMGVSGTINIPPFETVMLDLKSPDYWFNVAWNASADVRQPQEAPPFIPFDYFDADTSGCACVEASAKHIGESLWYFDHQFGTHDLYLTIPNYCQHLTRTRGIYGWQRALIGGHTEFREQVDAAVAKLFGNV